MRKHPIQNPSMPCQRRGPRPARTGGAATRMRPSPQRQRKPFRPGRPIAARCKARAASRKASVNRIAQVAPTRRWPALCESGKGEQNTAIFYILRRFSRQAAPPQSPCCSSKVAETSSVKTRLRRWPALCESGKENDKHRKFPCVAMPQYRARGEQIRRGNRSDAVHRRAAGGSTGEETPDSKSFHAVPTGRPPSGRTGAAAIRIRLPPQRQRRPPCATASCRRNPQRTETHSLECWPALSEREGIF